MEPLKTVKIRGKEYETVASRVARFRSEHPDWSIVTEVTNLTEKFVVVKATISNPDGQMISTAHSMTLFSVKNDCTLEDAETSAVGRALGFTAKEFAGDVSISTADEMKTKQGWQQPGNSQPPQVPVDSVQSPALPAASKDKKENKKFTPDDLVMAKTKREFNRWSAQRFPHPVTFINQYGKEIIEQSPRWDRFEDLPEVKTKKGEIVSNRQYLRMCSNYALDGDEFFQYKCIITADYIKEVEAKQEEVLV